MSGPVLVASYPLTAFGGPILTTPSFSPSAGELVVVKCSVADSNPLNAPTSSPSVLTFVQRLDTDARTYNNGIWTAPVVTAPGSITITVSAGGGLTFFSAVVERWSGAQLAASPVVDDRNGNGTIPSGTIITAGAGSVVSWLLGVDGNTPTSYIATSGTPVQELQFTHSNYVYQPAPSAGAQNYGVALPASFWNNWHMSAIELQAAPPQAQGNFFALM